MIIASIHNGGGKCQRQKISLDQTIRYKTTAKTSETTNANVEAGQTQLKMNSAGNPGETDSGLDTWYYSVVRLLENVLSVEF